jgi:hypothetical protein
MIVFQILAYTWVFYGLFLIYCTLRRAKLNGRLAKAPRIVQLVCYTYLGPGVLMDWFFNMTFGAASFVEWPWKYGLKSLFTERCSQHMNDVGWRGDYARWVCFGWLNLFDDNHCH